MKTLKNILIVATLALSAVAAVAQVDSGIGILPYPGAPFPNDIENPIVVEGRTTSIGRTAPVMPTNVAPATLALFTNANFRIVRNSDITFVLKFGSLPTNSAATSNAVLWVELSPNGRDWVDESVVRASFAQNGSNNIVTASVIVPASNFNAFAYGRIRGMSNTMTSGAGNMWPSNFWVLQWPRTSYLR